MAGGSSSLCFDGGRIRIGCEGGMEREMAVLLIIWSTILERIGTLLA